MQKIREIPNVDFHELEKPHFEPFRPEKPKTRFFSKNLALPLFITLHSNFRQENRKFLQVVPEKNSGQIEKQNGQIDKQIYNQTNGQWDTGYYIGP